MSALLNKCATCSNGYISLLVVLGESKAIGTVVDITHIILYTCSIFGGLCPGANCCDRQTNIKLVVFVYLLCTGEFKFIQCACLVTIAYSLCKPDCSIHDGIFFGEFSNCWHLRK